MSDPGIPYRIEAPDQGVLFVVSGPSGVGKSTLLHTAMARIDSLAFSVSATTRAPRSGERDGVDYHFLGQARFAELMAQGAFLEHATVYDRSYGTLRSPVEDAIGAGRSIVLDIDAQGAKQVRRVMPEAVHILILPPAIEVLEARLRSRGTDDEATIARRMALVTEQLGAVADYDYLVVNNDLRTAHASFEGVLLAEMARVHRRHSLVERVRGWLSD